MTSSVLDLTSGMPDHFEMPVEFRELAEWCARMGFVRTGYGFLADPAIGSHCLVSVNDPARVGWKGYLAEPDRLWHVASTGGDGSSVCLWLDDDGQQRVVHHGSGSGSVLFAVLPSALSVLRLFAVGYEEPCWNVDWGQPPEGDSTALDPYRQWVRERWQIATARTGLEALGVEDRAEEWTRNDGPEQDAFAEWLDRPGTVV